MLAILAHAPGISARRTAFSAMTSRAAMVMAFLPPAHEFHGVG
jgi:hypothetical protein